MGEVSFSGDKTYLAEVYPVMKGCAEFFRDFLVEDPNSGYMVVCPSNSPKNHPGLYSYTNDAGSKVNVALFGGVAMDNQMVYDILKNTAEAAGILGKDADFAKELDTLRARLTPYKNRQVRPGTGMARGLGPRIDLSPSSLAPVGRIPRQSGVALREPDSVSGSAQVAHRER